MFVKSIQSRLNWAENRTLAQVCVCICWMWNNMPHVDISGRFSDIFGHILEFWLISWLLMLCSLHAACVLSSLLIGQRVGDVIWLESKVHHHCWARNQTSIRGNITMCSGKMGTLHPKQTACKKGLYPPSERRLRNLLLSLNFRSDTR